MHYLQNETLLTTLIQLTFLHTYNTYNMNLPSKTTVEEFKFRGWYDAALR